MDIKVVGCILSISFHTTKFILLNLVKHRPDLIKKYIIKGVMDVQWARCLSKINQSVGGMKRQDMVTVFINKSYIGTQVEFQEYLISHYDFTIDYYPLNYEQLIGIGVQNYYRNDERTFVRMVFDVNNWKIGHVVLALFDELVPKTCKYFKQLCVDKSKGYLNSTIHRIDVNNGFIQAGHILNQKQYLMKENYLVNHDRRGVLSLSSRHTHFNGPDFIISLRSNSWMNNKYVAFGHIVEGENVLNMIETLSNAQKLFDRRIRIISCDVLVNYTLPIVKTSFETTIRSIIHTSVLKSLYINTYGKPGPLQTPFITDFQYMKSIVSNVLRKVENITSYQDSTRQGNNSENINNSDSISILNIQRSWEASKEKITPSNLRLYSNADISDGFSKTVSSILRPHSTLLLKLKNTDTREIANNKAYGINLQSNHKDYWKHKKIYESINK